MSENKIQIFRPFGPSIAKITMPIDLVDNLNDYVEKTIIDKKKSKELDHGNRLAGNVKQEFKLESEFIKSSGLLNFLGTSSSKWIEVTQNKKIKKFNISASWIVRQYKTEYNPIHHHGGHLSGVGYLKLPKHFGTTKQEVKKNNYNGTLSLIHGNKMFDSNSTFNIIPKVGEFYLFPHYLMHTVYPFYDSDEERRSISFNATIDDDIYNVYQN
jgi:hypothetical protein|tara:strand:- start:487 stop:1125 length:639 start_codon:yes stop_codon:yes gene_type:complete